MSTKHFAIYNPSTGLYSLGDTHSNPSWNTLDAARLWNSIHAVKCHMAYCNRLTSYRKNQPLPYIAPMEIVEVIYTNVGLAEKI
jgi:hypothetical protein